MFAHPVRRRLTVAIASALLISGVIVVPAVQASSTMVTVTPFSPNGWGFFDDNGHGGIGQLVVGPGTPPLGTGSAELAVGASNQGYALGTLAYAGTALSAITSLDYWSYQTGPTLAIALQFDIKYRPTDTHYDGRLVFEPYQNGAVVVGSGWQHWSPLSGIWWASHTGVTNGSNGLCPMGSPCPWATILSNWPSATISAALLFKAGGGWSSFDGNVDALTVGVSGNDTTYDFEAAFGACPVALDTGTLTMTLTADCTTDHTLLIPDGWTLDGAGHTITAVDPAGGHFVGGIVANAGGVANVQNTVLTTHALATVCDSGVDRLRGILLDNASGTVTGNTLTNIAQGPDGCQEGNAIEARNFTTTSDTFVTITNNVISAYQKTGVVANGAVAATVTGNTIAGLGPVPYIAQNGIQIGFGATAIVQRNTVSGNWYTGTQPAVSCGLLYYQASGVKASKNTLFANQRDQCNAGKGGGSFNPNQ